MNKGLQALKDLREKVYCSNNGEFFKRLDIIEKELKALEIIKKVGIALVIPETDFLNNEHLTIEVYKKHLSKDEWESLKEEVL